MSTRRRLLATAAGAATATTGLSGCLGSSDDGEPTLPPPAAGAESRDAADAVVRVWADFRCPHCATFASQVLPPLRENLVGERVRLEHHDFPVPVDRWSWRVASAARSVQARAGADAFWSFSEHAFANQRAMDDSAAIREAAGAAGADPDAVVDDVAAERYRPVVEADRATGEDRGVRGTPTVFVGDQQVRDTYDAVASAVRQRL